MSLNHVIHNIRKPWFNTNAKSMTVQGEFLYNEPFRAAGTTLKLVREGDALKADWVNVDLRDDFVYNNQVDLTVQGKTYPVSVNPQVISFSGFKYAAPSYYNLSADKKTLFISSPGYYLVIYNFGSFEQFCSSEIQVYNNGVIIPSSVSSFIPTRNSPTATVEQFGVCSASCIFRTDPGVNELQLKIVPYPDTTLDSRGSIVTVIKLSNFPIP